TSFEWTRAATSARVDMALAASLTAVLAAWTFALLGGRRWHWTALAAAGAALGTLAKGPVAIVLPALAAGVLALARRDVALPRRLGAPAALGVALLVAGAWYAAAFSREGSAFLASVAPGRGRRGRGARGGRSRTRRPRRRPPLRARPRPARRPRRSAGRRARSGSCPAALAQARGRHGRRRPRGSRAAGRSGAGPARGRERRGGPRRRPGRAARALAAARARPGHARGRLDRRLQHAAPSGDRQAAEPAALHGPRRSGRAGGRSALCLLPA